MQLYGRGTGERRETKPLCNFINCTFGHIFREKRCGRSSTLQGCPSPPERMRQRARRLERDGHRMGACVQTQALSCLRLQKQRILVAGASHHWHDIACKGILVSPNSSIVGDAVGMQHRHRVEVSLAEPVVDVTRVVGSDGVGDRGAIVPGRRPRL